MGKAPMALLLVVAVGFGWQFVYFDQELPGFDPANKIDDPNNSSSDTFGFLTTLGGVIEAVWDGVLLFGKLLTFSLVEGPSTGALAGFWEVFKWTFRVAIPGGILWSVISLARGA